MKANDCKLATQSCEIKRVICAVKYRGGKLFSIHFEGMNTKWFYLRV